MKKIVKRSISLLIILSLILSVLPVEFFGERSNVLAATSGGEKFTVNGLNYVILSDNTSVGVTGATDSSITELVIPETVNYDNYDFHVTEIRYQAFQNYARLTKILMGNNVEVIKDYGFSGCKNLVDVKLSNSLYDAGYKAFENCTRLESITLPLSLTGDASEMFSGCKSLKTVEFAEGATKIPDGLFKNGSIASFICPESIVEIGEYAFENCSNLKEVKFSDKLEIIGEGAFYNCGKIQEIELPKSLKEMKNGYANGAFSNCSSLKKINIPKSLKEGNLAFQGCSLLNEIEWEDGITKIPDGLFKNCAGLENVKIPDTVTEIGRYAFENCDNLEDVVLSEKMEILDEGAFYDCDKIQEIELPKSLKEMKNGYANGVFSNCSSLKKISIPKLLKEGNLAFKGCSLLNEIEWENGITKIPDGLFKNCAGLENVKIPDTVTEIGRYAFENCSNLVNISFCNNLQVIGEGAFKDCKKIKDINLPNGLQEMQNGYYNGPFSYCTGLQKVSIPSSLKKGYLAFKGCNSLSEIEWMQGITKIPEGLFRECAGLKSVVIPDTVTEIEDNAFAECSNLQEIYLPNNIVNIADNAFNKCPYLVMKMNRDSYASRHAIVNKIPFEWIGNSMENMTDGFLNRSGCEYQTVTQGATANGYINFKVKFGFKNGVKKSISDAHLRIYVPDDVTVIQNTVKINDILSTDFELDGNFLDIPVDNKGGVVTFSVQANNYDEFFSFSEIKYRKSNVDLCEMINALNTELQPLSLNMDSETSNNTFVVSGIVIPENNVDIYVDGKRYTSIQGTKAGTYATAITIRDMKKYKKYDIKVSSYNTEGVAVEQTQKITYIPQIPELTDFTMEHNGQKYNLSEQKKLKPIVVFNPSKKFQFKIKFQNADEIEDVYVVSNRSNIKKRINAIWNEDLQLYVAEGYFDENNHSYVPGSISVEYITKGQNHYINEDVDFSSDEYVNSIATEFENAKIEIINDTQMNFEAKFVFPNMGDAELNLQRERTQLDASVTEETLIKDGYIKVTGDFIRKNVSRLKASENSFEDDVLLFVKYAVSPVTNKIETQIVDLRDRVVEKVTMGTVTPGTIGIISDGFDWANTVDTWKGYRVDLNEARQSVLNSTMSYSDKEQAVNRIETVRKMNNGKVAMKMLGTLLSVAGYTVNPAIGMALSAMTFMYDRELNATMLDIKGLSAKESGSAAINFRWAVDPSGYIYDVDTKERVGGVTVTLYYKQDENSTAIKWNASEYLQQNPLVSAEDGEYAWDVPEGLYQVKCEKDGYQTAYSDWLPVPPPQLGINIGIKKKKSEEPTSTPSTVKDKTEKEDGKSGQESTNKIQTANKIQTSNSSKIVVSRVKIKAIKRKGTSAIISWKKSEGAKGYQLQYALNKKFKKKKSIQTKKTKYTIKKLKKKKTYYIRVRAYKMNGKKKVYGKWSKVKAVKRK